MTWWPWRRHEPDGAEARAAQEEATAQLARIHQQGNRVGEVERAASLMARQVDLFMAEVERALRGTR